MLNNMVQSSYCWKIGTTERVNQSSSLAAWFRSKYPYLVDGVVASSATIVAGMEFMEYYVAVGRALDTTGTQCRKEIKSATAKMYNWWGQPEKRTLMEKFFRLCDKIIHDALLDLSVFFYGMAENFAEVVQFNKNNREYLGLLGTHIAIETVCDIMADESGGDNVQRYADVNSLFLDTYKEPCLNLQYSKFVNELKYTELDNATMRKGVSQQISAMTCLKEVKTDLYTDGPRCIANVKKPTDTMAEGTCRFPMPYLLTTKWTPGETLPLCIIYPTVDRQKSYMLKVQPMLRISTHLRTKILQSLHRQGR